MLPSQREIPFGGLGAGSLAEFTLSEIQRLFIFAPLRVRMTSDALEMTRPERAF